MQYSKKDIIIGFIIIAVVIIGAYAFKRIKTSKVTVTPKPSPVSITFKKELEDNFKFNIPENTNSIELKDISGGNGRGLATNKEILADIEDPIESHFYEGWLENNGQLISLGKLESAKGGWLLDYDGTKYPSYKNIIVSLEKKFDNNIEKKVLEGSFN